VAQRLGMPASTVTRHVQALEDAAQVSVRPDPHDARTCLVEATAAGRAEMDGLERVGAERFAAVIEHWPDRDIDTLAELITRLRRDWAEREETARRRQPANRQPRWRRPPTAAPAEETP
jgi:DNA-binding MarR family transcriptional regulator